MAFNTDYTKVYKFAKNNITQTATNNIVDTKLLKTEIKTNKDINIHVSANVLHFQCTNNNYILKQL